MTVALVLRSGGIYDGQWVRRLARAIERHTSTRPQVVCLTDEADLQAPGVTPVELKHRWPGWYSKIELFRPDLFEVGERIFYLDLDTLVVADLDELLEAPGAAGLTALRDFYWNRMASGVMAWVAPGPVEVYRSFARDPSGAMLASARRQGGGGDWGDQAWIRRHLDGIPVSYWQNIAPGAVVSYKIHCRQGPPPGARLVCFHGRPKPHQITEPWVVEAWRGR